MAQLEKSYIVISLIIWWAQGPNVLSKSARLVQRVLDFSSWLTTLDPHRCLPIVCYPGKVGFGNITDRLDFAVVLYRIHL